MLSELKSHWLKKLIKIGTQNVFSEDEINRVRIANLLNLLYIFLLLPFLLFFYVNLNPYLLVVFSTSILVAISVYFLFAKGILEFGKTILLLNTVFLTFLCSLELGSGMYAQFTLLSLSVTPSILFTTRTSTSRILSRICIAIPAIAFFYLQFASMKPSQISAENLVLFNYLLYATTFVGLWMQLYIWQRLDRDSREKFETQNEELNNLFKSMIEGVVLQNEKGQIIQFNAAALKILGLSEMQLQGRDSFDPRWKAIKEDGSPFPGEMHPAIVALETGVIQMNKPMGVHHSDGSLHWIEITAAPIWLHDQTNPSRVLVTFRDVTEEKKLKNELNSIQLEMLTKSKLIHDIAANLPGMIHSLELSKSGALRTTYVSSGVEKLYGIKSEQALEGRMAMAAMAKPEYQKSLSEMLQKTAQTLESGTWTGEFVLPDRTEKWIQILFTPSRLDDGSVRWNALHMDITEQHKLQEKLVSTAKMSALGEMAGGVAHEINNPLAIILGKASYLRRVIGMDKLNEEKLIQELLNIENTTERIAKIVRGLRTFSRDAKQDPLESVNIMKLIDETLALCSEKFKYHSIQIDLKTHDLDGAVVLGQSTQLSQVIVNLLSNSFDAIEKLSERWVKIDVRKENSKVIFKIMDSGKGISKEVKDKMMQPFFTTKDIGKGTGLGLSISKGIIEQHHGNFYYDDRLPNTCFIIELPLLS